MKNKEKVEKDDIVIVSNPLSGLREYIVKEIVGNKAYTELGKKINEIIEAINILIEKQ